MRRIYQFLVLAALVLAATSPLAAQITIGCGVTTDFNNGIPADWTVKSNGLPLSWSTLASCNNMTNATGGSGEAACASSDKLGPTAAGYDTELISPPMNLPAGGPVRLLFAISYLHLSTDAVDIDISTDNGASWNNLVHFINSIGHPNGITAALTIPAAFYGAQARMRFRYYNLAPNVWDWWVQLDNVTLECAYADLTIEKAVSEGSAAEQTLINYTIKVTNQGPNNATHVHVQDDLHQSSNWVATDVTDGASFTVSKGIYDRVEFDISPLLVGQSFTGTITVSPTVYRQPQVVMNSPFAIVFNAAAASFGAPLTEEGLTGAVVLAQPNLACSALTNASEIAGKIALIDRGTCTFYEKAKAAQAAGAVGAIIANNAGGGNLPFTMAGTGPDPITIQLASVGYSDGLSFKSSLLDGVNVTLRNDYPLSEDRANTATVVADQLDPDPTNNSATVQIAVLRDSDGDKVADLTDGCPNDTLKTEPGSCGCGVPETDSDGDAAANCVDGCAFDSNKTAAGICGCGVSDGNSDGDGAVDCEDLCPDDPAKTAPSACGCGTADTDNDGDTLPNCLDSCPDDKTKAAPGGCGCGIPDQDIDANGLLDCFYAGELALRANAITRLIGKLKATGNQKSVTRIRSEVTALLSQMEAIITAGTGRIQFSGKAYDLTKLLKGVRGKVKQAYDVQSELFIKNKRNAQTSLRKFKAVLAP